MSDAWLAVVLVGAGAIIFKSAGPVIVGGHELPARAVQLVGALAPALLAAFVVTGTFASDQDLTIDARALGLAAAAGCVALRAPLLAAVVAAAAVTAVVRLL
ncbi:MAG: AzlD domain-containing protein [Dehalococcoidia bacterium]